MVNAIGTHLMIWNNFYFRNLKGYCSCWRMFLSTERNLQILPLSPPRSKESSIVISSVESLKSNTSRLAAILEGSEDLGTAAIPLWV